MQILISIDGLTIPNTRIGRLDNYGANFSWHESITSKCYVSSGIPCWDTTINISSTTLWSIICIFKIRYL